MAFLLKVFIALTSCLSVIKEKKFSRQYRMLYSIVFLCLRPQIGVSEASCIRVVRTCTSVRASGRASVRPGVRPVRSMDGI